MCKSLPLINPARAAKKGDRELMDDRNLADPLESDVGAHQWKFSLREHLWLLFEHFVILPIRWYRSHIHVFREARQRCKACGQADGFNFYVPDHIWAAVVPQRFLGLVVCLRCFDRFAKEREVDYSTSVSEFLFAGDKACFNWDLNSSVNIRD